MEAQGTARTVRKGPLNRGPLWLLPLAVLIVLRGDYGAAGLSDNGGSFPPLLPLIFGALVFPRLAIALIPQEEIYGSLCCVARSGQASRDVGRSKRRSLRGLRAVPPGAFRIEADRKLHDRTILVRLDLGVDMDSGLQSRSGCVAARIWRSRRGLSMPRLHEILRYERAACGRRLGERVDERL